jgi:hypothetical protein
MNGNAGGERTQVVSSGPKQVRQLGLLPVAVATMLATFILASYFSGQLGAMLAN